MESQTIIRRVRKMLDMKGHRFNCKNIYLYTGHEADVISVDRYDMIHEVEVKRSRNDFRADFEKGDKHHRTSNGQMANYFYFACPQGMLSAHEMPEYAGLIWVNERGHAWIDKAAPELHRDTITTEKLMKISEKMHNTK